MSKPAGAEPSAFGATEALVLAATHPGTFSSWTSSALSSAFGRRLLGRRLLGGGLLRLRRVGQRLDQLDLHHRRVVTLARTELGDPGVAARTVGVPLADLGEEHVARRSCPLIRFITWRREFRSPRFALVIIDSASGCRRLALAAVVVMAPCSNSDVARLLRISFSCAGLPPSRAPWWG
jgi:hypothetical protein